MSDSAPALDVAIDGVSLGRRVVLHALRLQIVPGEIVALIGPNGAGKTTLMRAIAGLVPARGRILIGGADAAQMSHAARARRLSYLAQGGQIHWPMPVRDIVALGRVPFGSALQKMTAEDREIVDRALCDCELLALADRPASALSGGERARVLLARALAVEAPVLLADEPVAALDPALQMSTLAILARQAAHKRAVVIVMHDLGLALRIATRFVALRDGRLVADGSPQALIESGDVARVFGVDFARASAGGVDMLAPLPRRVET